MAFTADDLKAFIRALAEHTEARAELARLLAEHFLRELRDEIRAIAEAQRRTDQHLVALAEAQRRTEERVGRVEEQLALLAEAQRRTEERVEALAEAQRRTEERVEALAEAQRRTEERVGRVEERVGRVEEQLALLAEAQRRTEERVEALAEAQRELTETVGRLAHDVAILKGMSLETHYLLHADGLFGAIARGIRVLDGPAKESLLGPAIEAGRLSPEEAVDVRRTDVLAVGRREDAEVYLVAEVSWAIDQTDVERARDRAALLQRAGVRALPVVAGQVIHPEVDEVARASGVWRVLDGSVRAPAA
jgi:tetratricopeptide (TPR) repeat protein